MKSIQTNYHIKSISNFQSIFNGIVLVLWILIAPTFINAQNISSSIKSAKKDIEFEISTLKNAGLNEQIIQAMEDSIYNGKYSKIHSVLLLVKNKLVFEKYWEPNEKNNKSNKLFAATHYRDSLHDIRSISNSVTAITVLAALGQGKIKSLDQSIMDFFPEYEKNDSRLKAITIDHLLNMTAGFEWNQEIAWRDPKNSEYNMVNSADAISFIFSQKIADTPGTVFKYSGACAQILAAIIKKATGLTIDKYADEFIFRQIGINQYTWSKIKDGTPRAASGLRLRSRDMAKLAILIMNDGKWEDRQVIPAEFVQRIFQSQVLTPYADELLTFVGYSNHFWHFSELINGRTSSYIQSQGNGGQVICLDKKSNLILVITAGDYNTDLRELGKSSFNIYSDFIYPSISN